MTHTVFKLVDRASWEAAAPSGAFDGSAADARDGFIHFSTAEQVRETAARHFAGQSDLLLVAVAAASLGDALRWEPSRGGALFPHLYAPLPLSRREMGGRRWARRVRPPRLPRSRRNPTSLHHMIPTKLTAVLVATTLLVSSPAGSATAISVLFIGNSFTFAAGSPVRYYRADTVTDLNGEGIGGVPALFESFTRQAGLDYEVSLETRGGSGLDFHLAEKADVIGRRGWDKVVMHGYSTLDSAKPRDPAKLIATSARMAALLREKNPKVEIYLMATWSRADQIYPAAGAWAGTAVDVMARDVRAAYDKAAREAAATAVIPVGEAWNRAIQTGVADANPYDGIDAGKLDLWTYDHYHASTYGSYLEALVIFGGLTGRDPRSLGDAECSGFELGLSRQQVAALQQVAFDQLAAGGTVRAVPSGAPPAAKAAAPARCTAAG